MEADQSAGSSLEISVEELKLALVAVLGAIEKVHGPTVIVDADYYWTLFVGEQFKRAAEPPSPTVGQLTDDLDSVRNLLANGGLEPLWHLLQHTMGLLAGAASTTLHHMVEVPAPPNCPSELPLGDGIGVHGLVDLVRQAAFEAADASLAVLPSAHLRP